MLGNESNPHESRITSNREKVSDDASLEGRHKGLQEEAKQTAKRAMHQKGKGATEAGGESGQIDKKVIKYAAGNKQGIKMRGQKVSQERLSFWTRNKFPSHPSLYETSPRAVGQLTRHAHTNQYLTA